MVTDAEQEEHWERKRARASSQVERLYRMADGSAPPTTLAEGESEYDQPRWIRHHRRERAEVEGDVVFGEEA